MKRGGFWKLLLLACVTVAVGVMSAGAAGAQAAYHGQVAGLLSDGTVYVTSPDDSLWHPIDLATFASSGYTYNDIQWYGSLGLPGSIAGDAAINQYKAFAELQLPPVNLAGLLDTGGVYVAQTDGLFHHVTADQFVKSGYSWTWVKWFGALPGSVAEG